MNETPHHVRQTDPSSNFDVCVVGHITRDIVKVGRTRRTAPGGTAYYTAMALKRLDLSVAVVTKGAKNDRQRLMRELTVEKVRTDEQGNNLIGWKFKPIKGKVT